MSALMSLGESVVSGELTLDDAGAHLRERGLDEHDLAGLLDSLDKAGTGPTPAQIAATRIAYDGSDLVGDRRLRVILAAAWGRLLMHAGELDTAGRVLREAETSARDVADMRLRAMVASLRASVAMLADDPETAVEARRRAIRVAREIGDARLEAFEEVALGSHLPDTDAREHLLRAVEIARREGLHDCEAHALYLLARIAARQPDDGSAGPTLLAAASAALAATVETPELLEVVGRIINMQYELDLAYRFEALLHLGERLSGQAGAVDLQVHYLFNLGLTAAANDRPDEARQFHRRARELALGSGDDEAVARIDRELADLGAQDTPATPPPPGDTTTAGRIVALADAVAAGELDINLAIDRLPPAPEGADDATAVVADLVDRGSDDAQTRGQWAYGLVTLTLFWAPDNVADAARYRLLMLWGTFSLHAFNVDDAIGAFGQAADLADRMGEPKGVVAALVNAGTALRRRGRPVEAAAVYDRAVELAVDCGPEVLAAAAVNAGTAHDDLRQYARARDLYATAVAIYARDPHRYAGELATALLNHGQTLKVLGDPAGAEAQLLQALQLQRERGVTGQEGVTLGVLGQLRIDRGNLADGFGYLLRALDIAEAEPDRWNAALWALDLASLCEATGMDTTAAGFYRRALDHSTVTGDGRTAAKAQLGLLGTARDERPGPAVRTLLRYWREYGGSGDTVLAARIAIRLAARYSEAAAGVSTIVERARLGNFDALRRPVTVRDRAALRQAHRWLDAVERTLARGPHDDSLVAEAAIRRAVLYRLAGRPHSAFRALRVLRRTVGATAPTYTTPDGQIAHVQIAILHQDLGNARIARRYIDAAIAAAEASTVDVSSDVLRSALRHRTAQLYQRGVDCAIRLGDPDAAYRYAERSKNVEGRRALLFRRPGQELEPPGRQDVRELAGELGNVVIVEFVPAVTKLYAFLFAPSLPLDDSVVELDVRGTVELAQALWQPLQDSYLRLKQPASAFDPGALLAWQAAVVTACAGTARRVLDPIARRIESGSFDAVIFVPHSVLHCLPLHACPIDGGELWIDRYRVSYAPSAAILAATARAPEAGDGFTAFANPTGDLPFSEVEVATAGAGQHHPRITSGAGATPSALLDELQTASRLHLACHATHGPQSSLVMAPGGDEGRVSLAHIQRDVTLRPGATVYLSACETGTVTPGMDDEFTSLAGGILFAGAASVVATLWRVRDACALVVADVFYSPRAARLPDAERLRRATAAARTMTEREVLHRLTALYLEHPVVDEARWERLTRPFERARTDHHPFSQPADWAAFFLAGRPGQGLLNG